MAVTQMNTSQLRHDLRTPLNHIVGYSQLMLEEAEQQGPGAEWVQPVRQVSAIAKQLTKTIEGLLPSSATPEPERQFTELRDALRKPVHEISEMLHSIQDSEGAASQAADIERLLQATNKLSHFIETGSLMNAPDTRVADTISEGVAVTDHLLLVDDDQANRDLLGRMLSRLNYRVTQACGGTEALKLVRKNSYDLMLLDILMPGMNGYEVLAEMKKSMPGIPVIVISAIEEMNSVIRCIEMGAEDYFLKPFDPVLLRARIAAALDRKKFRDRLVVQERMASLGELTAGVAHEIKNPLNFIINFSDLALETAQELERAVSSGSNVGGLTAELKQFLSKIKEHGTRADQIVKSMLLHARDDSSMEEPTDINRLVAQYVQLARASMDNEAASADVELRTEYDPATSITVCRPADLGRVVINLVANACHAVIEKKRSFPDYKPLIVVATRDLKTAIEIKVRDNGGGVPEEIQDKIFSPFFTTKPAGTGSGLGLSISYDIVVRGHHGQLTINSKYGSYAEFVIWIPKGQACR